MYHKNYSYLTPQDAFKLFQDNHAAVMRLIEIIDRSSPDYLSPWDVVELFDLALTVENKPPKPPAQGPARTQKSMATEFITKPGDVFTIKSNRGVICDTITVQVTNDETAESFYLGYRNELDAWKHLKRINEIAARRVMYQLDDDEPIDFVECIPYRHRFERGFDYRKIAV